MLYSVSTVYYPWQGPTYGLRRVRQGPYESVGHLRRVFEDTYVSSFRYRYSLFQVSQGIAVHCFDENDVLTSISLIQMEPEDAL